MIVYTDKWKIPFQIDEDDYEIISYYRWYICDKYVATWTYGYSHRERIFRKGPLFLHNFLLGLPPLGFEVDHINRDKLDYRRENLRIDTKSANNFNRDFHTEKNESGHLGIHRNGSGWVAFISREEIPAGKSKEDFTRKFIRLGTFKTIELAAAAREMALKRLEMNL